jgi:predicted permease
MPRLPWKREETELDREVQYHLDRLVEQFEREGLSPRDARRKAKKEFGGVEQVKEQCRDESTWSWATGLRQDVAFGWRMIRKTPIVAAAAVLSLGIGIGSNTAIFSLMHEALFKPMAAPAPEQLSVILWQANTRPEGLNRGSSGSNFREDGMMVADYFSYPAFESFRQKAAPIANVAGHLYPQQRSFSYEGRTEVASARDVSGNFFETLALSPFAGRLLASADDDAAAPPVIVVTHRFWRTSLGGNRDAVGKTIRVDNEIFTLAGVLPEDFGGISMGENTQAYIPMRHSPRFRPGSAERKWYDFGNAERWWVQMIARRKPGVTDDQLRQFLDSIYPTTWIRPAKSPEMTPHIRVQSGAQGLGELKRRFQQPMYVLLGLAGLTLLIACANIANLMLARGDARRKEAAVRLSLGCSQGRLVRQFLTESVILAVFGGLLSVVFAVITGRALLSLTPTREPLLLNLGLDFRLLIATLAVTVVTVAFFGVFPAIRAARVDSAPALKDGAGSAGGAAHSWWTPGKILVVAQVAFAVVLAATATLFTRNLQRIVNTDAGFDRANLILFDVKPGQIGYKDADLARFYRELEERIAATAGVEAVALTEVRPMNVGGNWNQVQPVGGTDKFDTAVNSVTTGLFPTLGIRIVAGRGFAAQDIGNASKIAIISEDLAHRMAPGYDALGRRFKFGGDRDDEIEIVGIAANASYSDLKRRPSVVYRPASHKTETMTVVIRTAGPPMTVFPFIRESVKKLNPDLPLVDTYTMEQLISNGLRRERMFAYLCGGFGVLAVVLSAIGLYGVISYAVARRRNEIGIRMALGATRPAVVNMILREGLFLTALGLLLGAPAIYYGSQLVEKELNDMKPLDPSSLVIASVTLLVAAFVAALLPSLRAAATDPVNALRQD